jgi:WD40 repeat protein
VQAAAKLNDEYKTPESLYQAFQYGIMSAIAWSPDGRYLAFGGQMDGLSSDLYVYDVQTSSIQRLSSGDQELQWIDWSPDGKWILHGSLFAVGAGMTYDVYAATLNGASAPYLSTSPMGAGTWLNDHQYIEHDAENGPGNYGLRLVDVKTGNITKLWDGAFVQYAVSPSGKWVLLFAMTYLSPYPYQEDPADFQSGWKLINLQTLEKTDAPEFLADPPNVFLRAEDGEIIPLILKPYPMGVDHVAGSPDSQYWVVANDEEIKLFSTALSLLLTVPNPSSSIRDIMWSPDSSGLFLIYETEIYSMNISDGTIRLVDSNLITDNYNPTYKWIDSQ